MWRDTERDEMRTKEEGRDFYYIREGGKEKDIHDYTHTHNRRKEARKSLPHYPQGEDPKKEETKTINTHTRQNEQVGDLARERRDNDKKEKQRNTISLLQIR